jgi:hypothetical protein
MKFYEVEYRAVITLAAQDMQKAALYGAAVIKDNPHLIYLRAVHERNFEPAWEDPSLRNSQKGTGRTERSGWRTGPTNIVVRDDKQAAEKEQASHYPHQRFAGGRVG